MAVKKLKVLVLLFVNFWVGLFSELLQHEHEIVFPVEGNTTTKQIKQHVASNVK